MTHRSIELDVLRALAIALALGWHFYTPTGIAVIDWLQWPGHAFGWAGVDLFFVLSGYLVGGLIFGEVARSGGFDAKRFLVRRIFKIWPVLYAYIALVVMTGRYHPMEVVPQTLLHVQNFWTMPITHLWSLAVEEHFYLTFAAAAMVFRIPREYSGKVPKVLLAIMLVAPALRILAITLGVDTVTVQIQTQYRADALAFGALLAYVKVFRPALFASLVQRKVTAAAFVALGLVFLIASRESTLLISTIGYSITATASAALVLLLSGGMPNPGRVAKAVAWVGTYSYATYVFQFVMFRALEKAWAVVLKSDPPALAMLGMRYFGAIALAVVVTKLIERPSLALRDRLFPAT